MIKTRILFLVIILLAFVFRLYRLNGPVADWHSWRQADTAAVARNFLKFGFDPLRPRYDDLSNIQSGKDNLLGYRMVEFPVYQTLGVGLFKLTKMIPGMTIEIALRLISILASLGTAFFLFSLARKRGGDLVAFCTLIVFCFLPYGIFYSRAILPEMLAVFFAIGALWVFDKSWFNAAILSGLALLTKPTAGFLLLPLVYFWLRNPVFGGRYFLKLFLFSLFAVLPFLFWRYWIGQYPEGIPANFWLLNDGNIRFSGAYFYWLLGERLAKLISGYWLIVFLVIGLISKSTGSQKTNLFLLAGTVLYALVFARGNVQHDYYQILWLPILAIFLGQGMAVLLSKNNNFQRLSSLTMVLFCFLLGTLLSWREIRSYYWINNPAIVEAGLATDKLIPKDAKVIAPYGGDTAFLYQTNRQGWPVGFEIEKKITLGADYYVNTNVPDLETQYVLKKWTPIVTNDRFVIVKLR
ncbi:MAG: glycosyltransferase family 39 protein [Patescibacteria group bacterium]|nr:glycosyltransferase family 39 protein [Patescibacteria group bacterium]MCL5095139.1 glycosyltransferase family 39 protein [Patescibacteria group bacterium]